MPTSITTRQWYIKVYEDEHANTQLDPATDAIIPGQINTIAIDWVVQTEDNGDFDIMLIQDFQGTFTGWSIAHFNAMDTRVRTAVKNILRDRGVYIEKNSRNTIAQQLFDVLILTRSPDWPIDELNIMRLNPDFKCCQIAEEAQLARITRQSSNQPLPPTRRYTRDTQPSVPANSSVTTTQQKEQEKKVENTVDKDNVACGPNYVPTIGTTDNTIVDQPSLPKVSIAAHTDLRSLYNFLVKLGTTKEKHRMIDIMTLREAYGHNDLMDIRWIDSRDNLVDAITKARWVDRDKTGIGTINNQLQYEQDRHQAYEQDRHRTYRQDRHRAYERWHRAYKQDRHQAYEQDRHRAYRQDRHRAYKQDRHRAYERWHRTHE
ncbi:hypothetical protein PTTW11_05420 [Pyrenophora teres f. teres]|uniref:Uncharacterized protein n=1 Tax=Pyrenophora teres f. teres TaxID=97479 RepID=A0A6S6W1P1_9PLEO|nr:hypothetical protein PTTW11_05420 [Pyrenophora teres f. teres]